jgi:hypothetical protein
MEYGSKKAGKRDVRAEVPTGTPEPFNRETELDLYKAYQKARRILGERRVEMRVQPSPKDSPATTEKERKGLAHEQAEVQRIDDAIWYANSRKTPEQQQLELREKALSDIHEAMLVEGLEKLLGHGATVFVPSSFDEKKKGADIVVAFKDDKGFFESGLLIDAATEQDVLGYTHPVTGMQSKGIEEKMDRSYQHIFKGDGRMGGVTYTKNSRDMFSGMPRVVLGASHTAIEHDAIAFAKGELDPKTSPLFAQLIHSTKTQLLLQLRLAREISKDREKEKKEAKSRGEDTNKLPKAPDTKKFDALLTKLKPILQEDTKTPPPYTDSVIAAIHKAASPQSQKSGISPLESH